MQPSLQIEESVVLADRAPDLVGLCTVRRELLRYPRDRAKHAVTERSLLVQEAVDRDPLKLVIGSVIVGH